MLEREDLIARVRRLEPVMARLFRPLAAQPRVADVRTGIGLLCGIDVRDDPSRPELAMEVVRAARAGGVITRALRGRTLQISPPFVVTEPELERIAGVLGDALAAIG